MSNEQVRPLNEAAIVEERALRKELQEVKEAVQETIIQTLLEPNGVSEKIYNTFRDLANKCGLEHDLLWDYVDAVDDRFFLDDSYDSCPAEDARLAARKAGEDTSATPTSKTPER